MPNKSTKNSQLHGYSSHRYQSIVQEIDQMLKQNESNTQKSEQSSEKHANKPKNLVNNSPTGVKEFDELLDGGFPDYEGIMAGSSKKIREIEEEEVRLKKIIKEKEEMEKSLQNSEERFRDISYNMADWIWEIDKDGKYTFSSGNVKKILGYDPEELIGKTPLDLMSEDEIKHAGKKFLKIISEEKLIVDFENWNLTKNDEKVCLLTNGVPLFDEDGKFTGYRGVDKDITERKKMEQDLRIKDNAIMSSINAIAFVNLEGEVIYVNPSLLNMWEYDSENRILGKPAVDLWQMKEQYIEIMDALKNEGGWVGELTAKRADGSLFIVQISASMVKDGENNPICMMASFMDVTDRKRMERNLKKFKTITDRADYGSITYDIEGNIFYTNESFVRMHGYSMEEVIGKNLSTFYNENQVERIEQLNDYIKRSGSFVAEEIWHKRKDGTVFPVLMTSTLIKDEKKKLSFLAATVIDITDIKNAEKKLRSNANKLRNLNGELNLAKEELSSLNKNLEKKVKERTVEIERLLKQKDEFIGQLGHDLKTPLTPMMTLLPLLRTQMKDAKSVEMLDTVIRNVHFMKDLVIETIDLTGINSTNMEFSIEDIDLLSEVNNIIKNNKILLEDNNFKVENKINENIIIEADKLRFEEIFNNLISNAIKYTPENGSTITIDAKKGKDFVTISMSDMGIGMTEEQLRYIFDEFYKADGSRHDLYSHGLGLSICKNIVEKHGGKIWAESPGNGKGSTFYFTFKCGGEK
jgi:PAS domain S-box-containing protein